MDEGLLLEVFLSLIFTYCSNCALGKGYPLDSVENTLKGSSQVLGFPLDSNKS